MTTRDPSSPRDPTLGEPGLFRQLLRPSGLESVFLFVTSRCNSRCATCFYGSRLNDGRDLPLEALLRLAETAPRFDKLWLSGGEPTLRSDLPSIVEAFVEHAGVETINFPTNGLLADKLDGMLEEILERCPELTIHLNFSIDGFRATHDAIRGVPGGFDKTIHTMERILSKYAGTPRLHVNVATVITPQAIDELADLGWWLFENLDIQVHFFETVRGDPPSPEVATLDSQRLRQLHEDLAELHAAQAAKLFADLPWAARVPAVAAYLGVLDFIYRIHEQNIEGPHAWPMPCTAGRTTVVVDHDGGFRACELRRVVGNVADYAFDLRAVFASTPMQKEVEAIQGGRACWCTHTCWILSSLKFSPWAMLTQVPAGLLRAAGKLGLGGLARAAGLQAATEGARADSARTAS